VTLIPASELARQKKKFEDEQKAQRTRFPARPTRDVLVFLMRHAPLQEWQQDILSIIRAEA